MNPATSAPARMIASNARTSSITKIISGSSIYQPTAAAGLRTSFVVCQKYGGLNNNNHRSFSTTRNNKLKEFFPAPKTRRMLETGTTSFPHPVYSEQELKDIEIAHRQAQNWSDWIALSTVRTLRWWTDLATGYRPPKTQPKEPATTKDGAESTEVEEAIPARFVMTERKWLIRFIFLETVAGVPGMVGGMLRHLRSLRRMKRDNGWIESLLEEAYNERMHLLTFLKLAEPGLFMRAVVLAAQGVFFNAFFVSYLISPRTCHRFVGYLEEEAVITYTHAIDDLDRGNLPNWEQLDAPKIAVKYWKMPEGSRKMKDLLLYVRADEAKHREVNHTLGNMDQKTDPNPFAAEYRDPNIPHPNKGFEKSKPTGWDRDEVL